MFETITTTSVEAVPASTLSRLTSSHLVADRALRAAMASRCGLPPGPDGHRPDGRPAAGCSMQDVSMRNAVHYWSSSIIAAHNAISLCGKIESSVVGITSGSAIAQRAHLVFETSQAMNDLHYVGNNIIAQEEVDPDDAAAWRCVYEDLVARLRRSRDALMADASSEISDADAYRLAADIVGFSVHETWRTTRYGAHTAQAWAMRAWLDSGIEYLDDPVVRGEVRRRVAEVAASCDPKYWPGTDPRGLVAGWLDRWDSRVQEILAARRPEVAVALAVCGAGTTALVQPYFDGAARSFEGAAAYGAPRGLALVAGLPTVAAITSDGFGDTCRAAVVFAEPLVAAWFDRRTREASDDRLVVYRLGEVADIAQAKLAAADFVQRWCSTSTLGDLGSVWRNHQETWAVSQALCL